MDPVRGNLFMLSLFMLSYTTLFTANKEKTLRVARRFPDAWLYGQQIHETLWPKYGKEFSFLAEFVGGKNETSSASNSSYVDAPAADPIDDIPEYDIPSQDPYENYDKEVSLSDNDLPF